MTGAQLKALRSRSGLGPARFGALLGYTGRNIARTVFRLEGMADLPIPEEVAARAAQFERNLERIERERGWAVETT